METSLDAASPEARAELIQALAARSALNTRPSLRRCLGDGEPLVRIAAAKGLTDLGNEEDAPALIAYYKTVRTAEEMAVAERALSAVTTRNPQSCLRLILSAFVESQGDQRLAMLRMLGSIGGPEALATVRNEMKAVDPNARDAALRTLAAWPEADALPDLLAIVKSDAALKYKLVAFDGYIRLLREAPQVKDRAQLLAATMEIVPRPEDKKLVLAALAESPGPESLKLAAACLSDPGLVEEAAIAVVSIAGAKGLKNTAYPAATAALAKVLQVAKIQSTRQQAQDILRKLEETSKGTKPPRP